MNFQEPHITRYFSNFIRWSWILGVVAFGFQTIFFTDLTNFTCGALVLLGWKATTSSVLNFPTISRYPISSVIVLGFATSQLYFPLLFTSIENKSLINNLALPLDIFIHSFAALVAILTTHFLYRLYDKRSTHRLRKFLIRLDFFKAPGDNQVWMMGATGLLAMFYIHFLNPASAEDGGGGAFDKIIAGLIPFAYSPFFLPLGRLYGRVSTDNKRLYSKLILFALLLFIVSVASNIRSAFLLGFVAAGLSLCIGMLLGIYDSKIISPGKMIIAGLVAWLMIGPIADLSTAMVIARSQKSELSRADLLSLTFKTFNDKDQLRARQLDVKLSASDWDEFYVDNVFLQKFANLKFNDNSLVAADKLGTWNRPMLDYSIDRVWAMLPGPVLTVLQVEVDKETVSNASFGDFLFYTAGANSSVLGGRRSGHLSGTGMAAFGWWYLLVLAVGLFPAFYIVDSFYNRVSGTISRGNLQPTGVLFSLCVMISMTSFFQFLPAESPVYPFAFIIRGFVQMVFLYFLLFKLTAIISKK
ncbi:MAG: hypothetical protein EOO05_00325 [Chitinophagaceae bacterium]|nr:MAG: hypothetical protein EOO05_00325 [Chitinophagaceae bacterium]